MVKLEQDIQHEGKGDYCSKCLSIMSTQKSNKRNWSKLYQNSPPNYRTTQKVHELNDLTPSSTNTSYLFKSSSSRKILIVGLYLKKFLILGCGESMEAMTLAFFQHMKAISRSWN
jgi:hypothetical protein